MPRRAPFYRSALPRSAAGALVALPCAPAAAQPEDDKSAFTLFNPTPRALMRAMSTDRPDATESPYTVDAGHWQLELSFIDSTLDRRSPDGTRTSALAVAPLLLKVGLTNNIDLQLGLDPFTRVHTTPAGSPRDTAEGFGDTVVRLKINLLGNDDDGPAFGVMPYIKFPTADDALGNGDVEGGVILPFAAALPAGFQFGAMLQFDARRTADDDSTTVDCIHTATISHALPMDLGAFVEYAGLADLRGLGPYRASVNTGLTLAITEDVQLDGGVRLGLTRAAEDLAVFAGLSVRF